MEVGPTFRISVTKYPALDYWTFVLGPKFFAKERRQVKLSRTYAISQVE
jgi:hypothetical protein